MSSLTWLHLRIGASSAYVGKYPSTQSWVTNKMPCWTSLWIQHASQSNLRFSIKARSESITLRITTVEISRCPVTVQGRCTVQGEGKVCAICNLFVLKSSDWVHLMDSLLGIELKKKWMCVVKTKCTPCVKPFSFISNILHSLPFQFIGSQTDKQGRHICLVQLPNSETFLFYKFFI